MTASKSSVSVVLVLAGLIAWVGTQRLSIASLEKEITAMQWIETLPPGRGATPLSKNST